MPVSVDEAKHSSEAVPTWLRSDPAQPWLLHTLACLGLFARLGPFNRATTTWHVPGDAAFDDRFRARARRPDVFPLADARNTYLAHRARKPRLGSSEPQARMDTATAPSDPSTSRPRETSVQFAEEQLFRLCKEHDPVPELSRFYSLLTVPGCDVNTPHPPLRRTALHRCAIRGHTNVLRLLLACGASPEVTDVRGVRPLHEAAVAGHVQCCRALLEAGADASPVKQNGSTPLHRAIKNGHFRTARLLLESGADPIAASCGIDMTPMKMLLRADEPMTSLALLVLDRRRKPVRHDWGRVGTVWKESPSGFARRSTSAWLASRDVANPRRDVKAPPPLGRSVPGKAEDRKKAAANKFRKAHRAVQTAMTMAVFPWLHSDEDVKRGVVYSCDLPDDFHEEITLMVRRGASCRTGGAALGARNKPPAEGHAPPTLTPGWLSLAPGRLRFSPSRPARLSCTILSRLSRLASGSGMAAGTTPGALRGLRLLADLLPLLRFSPRQRLYHRRPWRPSSEKETTAATLFCCRAQRAPSWRWQSCAVWVTSCVSFAVLDGRSILVRRGIGSTSPC